MKYDLTQLKTLAEAGDKAALDAYLLTGIERADVETVAKTNADVKSYFDSQKDQHFTTALETWKSNHLTGLIDDAVRKANPEQTEEQKRIAALEKQLEDQATATQREKLTNLAMKEAGAKGLPTELIGFFLGEDEDRTKANLGTLESVYNTAIQAAVESKFKENGRDVKGGAARDSSIGASFAKNANEQAKPVETTLWD